MNKNILNIESTKKAWEELKFFKNRTLTETEVEFFYTFGDLMRNGALDVANLEGFVHANYDYFELIYKAEVIKYIEGNYDEVSYYIEQCMDEMGVHGELKGCRLSELVNRARLILADELWEDVVMEITAFMGIDEYLVRDDIDEEEFIKYALKYIEEVLKNR